MSDIIFLLDEYENIIGHLSNQAEKACPYYDDLLKEDKDTGAQTYEFYVPAAHPDAERIKKNGYILRSGFDGKLLQFQISRVEETRNGETIDLYIFCEFSWTELNGNIIRPYSLPGTAARAAAVYALTGTRWQPGQVDYLGTADLSSQAYDTSLKMLQDIKDAFNAELQFYVEVKNNKIVGRYVDILQQVGSNEGITIHFGKNLTGAKRIHDRANVATALIGIGKGDEGGEQLTFSSVTWSKSKGDPADKPAGQDWIGDEEARETWGVQGRHITMVYEYNTTSPAVLLQKTWEKLQEVKNGFLQYEASAAFLDESGFDITMAKVGDSVAIHDNGFNPPLMVTARIISLERSFTDPEKRTATFGEYETAYSQAAALAELQSTLLKNQTKWETAPEIDLPENVAEVIRTPIEPERRENIIWIDPATPNRPFDLIKTWNVQAQRWEESAPMPEYIDQRAEAAAQNAQTAAENYAKAQAAAAQTAAQAHADNIITAEEAARIKQASDNLAAARTYAEQKAAAAELSAKDAAKIYAQNAQTAAEEYAEAEAEAARIAAEAHADGVISEEEAARIAQANSNLASAKTYAEQQATAAKTAAQNAAKEYTESYSEKLIIKQTTAPGHLSGRLWLDTSKVPNVLYRSDGKNWIKITPTTPGDIGAEDPDSATNKAKVQAYRALKNQVITNTTETVNRGQIVIDNASYYTSGTVSNVRNAIGAVNTQSSALQTAIDNAIADGIITITEENNLSTLKTQFDNAIKTATNAIQASTQDAGGLRVGTITGITLNVTNAGMTNDTIGDAATRLWAGATFASRNSAPFRVQESGAVYASNITIAGGSINISKDATVGNNLYVGSPTAGSTRKYIYFNNNTNLSGDSTFLQVNTGQFNISTSGGILTMGSNIYYTLGSSSIIEFQTGTFRVYGSSEITRSLDISGATNANSTFNAYSSANFYGSTYFHSTPYFTSGGRSNTYYTGGEFVTGNYETGFCGVGGFNPSSGGTGGSVAGTGVSFRIKKNYTPGSVSLSTWSHNVNGSANFAAIDVNQNGFWLHVMGSGRTGQFVYWRGTYNA